MYAPKGEMGARIKGSFAFFNILGAVRDCEIPDSIDDSFFRNAGHEQKRVCAFVKTIVQKIICKCLLLFGFHVSSFVCARTYFQNNSNQPNTDANVRIRQ